LKEEREKYQVINLPVVLYGCMVPRIKGRTQTKGISEQRNIHSILHSSLLTALHELRNSNNAPVSLHEHLFLRDRAPRPFTAV
jgi:hypothetical protein